MSKCKHCLNTEKNEIGETICFCEEYDGPVNVTQGDCFGNCEMEETELRGENKQTDVSIDPYDMKYIRCGKGENK